jgi:hypothetical protein
MSHLAILICRVDEASQPERLTQLDRIDVPLPDAGSLRPGNSAEGQRSRLLVHRLADRRGCWVSSGRQAPRGHLGMFLQRDPGGLVWGGVGGSG